MARDYARKNGFKGAFYLEPKPKEPTKHQYDFDAATCMNFIRTYGLEGDFKLNIEANHATLAGHTFQHELRTAAVNGAFGSIDANQGDLLLGWDTDQFPTNIYETTMCMYEVIKVGELRPADLTSTQRPADSPTHSKTYCLRTLRVWTDLRSVSVLPSKSSKTAE